MYIADPKPFWEEIINMPEGLSCEQVRRFFDEGKCPMFIIPTSQIQLKMHGLVLCNPSNRDGATEESANLASALKDIGVNVSTEEWDCFDSLRSQLKTKVKSVRNDCALLIVGIMAHGFGGHVRGDSDSSHGEINILFDEVTDLVPAHIPVVSLIHMCLPSYRKQYN